jgi:hypothetical protein
MHFKILGFGGVVGEMEAFVLSFLAPILWLLIGDPVLFGQIGSSRLFGQGQVHICLQVASLIPRRDDCQSIAHE